LIYNFYEVGKDYSAYTKSSQLEKVVKKKRKEKNIFKKECRFHNEAKLIKIKLKKNN